MTSDGQRHLVFTLDDRHYAVPLNQVAEVTDPLPTFPIPRGPSCFMGAANFHGRLVAVIDLAAYLNIGSFADGGKFLVLDSDLGSLAFGIGTTVDIINEAESLEEEESEDPRIVKTMIFAGGEVSLLHLENLLKDLERTINE